MAQSRWFNFSLNSCFEFSMMQWHISTCFSIPLHHRHVNAFFVRKSILENLKIQISMNFILISAALRPRTRNVGHMKLWELEINLYIRDEFCAFESWCKIACIAMHVCIGGVEWCTSSANRWTGFRFFSARQYEMLTTSNGILFCRLLQAPSRWIIDRFSPLLGCLTCFIPSTLRPATHVAP